MNKRVIVIGGGAAGMLAAGTAAERGLNVVLIEKKQGFGKKADDYGQRKMQHNKCL